LTADPLVIERRIGARPEQVWPYLTDGALWQRWQGAHVTIDPRPGGAFSMRTGDGREAAGRVLEVEPGERLTFSWGWTDEPDTLPPGSTTVEIELLPDGDGTLIRLTHRDLPEAAAPLHEMGWLHYMSRLEVLATGGDPGPDPGLGGQVP
jgi:uncharacterized protein YndB with AHSA1/START domain